MTPSEAIQHIKRHIEVHRIKEPQAIYITEALKMACDALEKSIAEIEPLRVVIESDNESIDEIIKALKTQKCAVMPDSESNVEYIDIEAIKSEAVKEFTDRLIDNLIYDTYSRDFLIVFIRHLSEGMG